MPKTRQDPLATVGDAATTGRVVFGRRSRQGYGGGGAVVLGWPGAVTEGLTVGAIRGAPKALEQTDHVAAHPYPAAVACG